MRTNYLQDMAVWLTVGTRVTYDEQRDEAGNITGLLPRDEEFRALLVGKYAQSGQSFTIRQHYSGTIVGRARGGNYDRQGAALADALRTIYGLPRFDGAVGESTVREWARSQGVAVYELGSALHSLPGVIN